MGLAAPLVDATAPRRRDGRVRSSVNGIGFTFGVVILLENPTKANDTIGHFPVRIAAITALLLSIAGQRSPRLRPRTPGRNSISEPTVSDAAAEAEFRPDFAVCLKQHPAVRPSEHCTAEEIEFQDARLDVEYRALLNSLHGAARDALQADRPHCSWDELQRRGARSSAVARVARLMDDAGLLSLRGPRGAASC